MGLKSEKLLGTGWEQSGNFMGTHWQQQQKSNKLTVPKKTKKKLGPTLVACMLIGYKIFFSPTCVCSLPFLGNARDPKSRGGGLWKHEKTKHETLLLRGGEERVEVPFP